MKKAFLIAAISISWRPLWAANVCMANQSSMIDSEVRCVDQGGIGIGLEEEDGAKVSCMESKEVRGRCGPDGRLTRLHAYAVWFNKLKQFQDQCSAQGGTFSFQDPSFIEPTDESYCLQAIPEIGSNMFEEPLCNYRSVCPAVTVTCDRTCPEHTVAKLY